MSGTVPPAPEMRPTAGRPGDPRASRGRLAAGAGLLALVLLALAGAAVAEQDRPSPAAVAAQPTDGVPVPAPTAGSWYCPVTAGQRDTAVLTVAAVGDDPATVVVDRHEPDGVRAEEPVELAPGTAHDLVLDEGAARWPSTVRWTGGPVVAVWRVQGPDVAGAACETEPAATTHIPGFDTAAASESSLHLFNPFADDAVARVTFGTDTGPTALVRTDNVLVPAGQRMVLDLNDLQPAEADLAVTVDALAGRVVAQGSVALAPTEDQPRPTGRAVLRGAAADLEWAVAYARADDTSDTWLSVFNPGEREAAVEVRAAGPAPDAAERLGEVAVPPGSVVRVDLAGASDLTEFGVVLESLNEVPVVATRMTAVEAGNGAEGVAAALGTRPARGWALVGGGTRGRQSRVALHNPGVEPVAVRVEAGPGTPDGWDRIELPPNASTALELAEVGGEATRAAIVVLVEADGPVTADVRSQVTGEEDGMRFWTPGGVPASAWEGPGRRPPVVRDPSLATRPAAGEEGEPGSDAGAGSAGGG